MAAPTIFVLDDDEGLLILIEGALRAEGWDVASASSSAEAASWLAKNTADLLLLDLKLREVDAREFIGSLFRAGRPIPFIVITGQGDERVAVDMMKRGALDYLVKDVNFIEFVPAVVRRALEQVEKDRQLLAAQSALKESQEQLLAISEREQARFGAELHDGLGQQLTAIELLCQSLKVDLPRRRPDLAQQISEISQHLREAVSQTRSLARGLSPVHLGSGGLVESLGELAARMSKTGKTKCVFDSSTEIQVGDDRVARHLFRIAQEAVNNAYKHSGASEVRMRLHRAGGDLILEISDNGRGLPKARRANQGIGMQIMKHRASVIGAELEINSAAGKGVFVACSLRKKNL